MEEHQGNVSHQGGNGTSTKLVWWLLSGMAAILTTGMWLWVASNTAQLNRLEQADRVVWETISQLKTTLALVESRQQEVIRLNEKQQVFIENLQRRLYWLEYSMKKPVPSDPGEIP